ncbi:hypothetical protein BKA63DRAFT_501473 [Paraphoma chrysanthemicola]|nr:hypothetical protein BKA63DRAFT_501473 [Paraphoma chrysanthemicola]
MYEREDIVQSIKMMGSGLFPRPGALVTTNVLNLEDWDAALTEAAQWTGIGKRVVFTPQVYSSL